MRVPVTLALLVTTLMAALAPPADTEPRRRALVARTVDGFRIAVREVLAGRRTGRDPVLLLHGARVPSAASFDLPVPNGSLAEDLARAGHPVYLVDARGYGSSQRPEAMQRPPERSAPLVRGAEVVRDLDAAVDLARRRTGAERVALFGWATGGQWAGLYAALHPDKVGGLILFNSLYGGSAEHPGIGHGSPFEDPDHPGRFHFAAFGGYRHSTAAALLPSWDSSIPDADKSRWRDPEIAAAYQREALASDPRSAEQDPPAFRAPSGALEDSFYLATGRRLWDGSAVGARVLIVRSERDFWSRPADVTDLRRDLVHAAEVRAVTLAGATHYAHLDRPERGRDRLLAELLAFLDG
ncbi:alpha/beta hydrolase [Actinokineospora iranica]|uniref:Lysophospholipase, alpha-beta hydrolase superfamily n=1 Tax=Actinokineospora iranica TaxID=1271860 RepID=A0A1G6S127_9PSEU|nr:alpha/beta hydrolase [Actinokineospora iranica]SDD10371.1 Lysophospholipase, alpha-beta hydrolase superfamily [Actinokineospora iranica]